MPWQDSRIHHDWGSGHFSIQVNPKITDVPAQQTKRWRCQYLPSCTFEQELVTSNFSSVGQWCLPPKLFSPSPQLATEPDRLDSDQRQVVRQDGSQPALADERWTFSERDMNFTLIPTSWPSDSAHNGGDGAGKKSAHYSVQPRSSGWQIFH